MASITIQPPLYSTGGQGAWSGELDYPNECPICHVAVMPIFAQAFAVGMPAETTPVECVFRCTKEACQRTFMAACDVVGSLPNGLRQYAVRSLKPTTPRHAAFDEVVEQVSSSFVVIYNQAMEAEAQQLDQIVGIGLRKSLEFLIKDFIIKRHPDEQIVVERKPLVQCIRDHVDDDMLRECALRAVWLGNDETHYVRKWTERDVSDLKKLIRLTVLWIERLEYTAEFIRDMPPSGPPAAPAEA